METFVVSGVAESGEGAQDVIARAILTLVGLCFLNLVSSCIGLLSNVCHSISRVLDIVRWGYA